MAVLNSRMCTTDVVVGYMSYEQLDTACLRRISLIKDWRPGAQQYYFSGPYLRHMGTNTIIPEAMIANKVKKLSVALSIIYATRESQRIAMIASLAMFSDLIFIDLMRFVSVGVFDWGQIIRNIQLPLYSRMSL